MTAAVDSDGSSAEANTINGQCQRYQVYERSPIQVRGAAPRKRSSTKGRPGPAAMSIAVPITGSSAAVPGKGVVAESANAPSSTSAAPAAPTAVAPIRPSRPQIGAPSATRAPAANSHARVGAL